MRSRSALWRTTRSVSHRSLTDATCSVHCPARGRACGVACHACTLPFACQACSALALLRESTRSYESGCAFFSLHTDVDEQSKKQIKETLMQYDRTLLVSSRLVPSRCALCVCAGPPGGSYDCQRRMCHPVVEPCRARDCAALFVALLAPWGTTPLTSARCAACAIRWPTRAGASRRNSAALGPLAVPEVVPLSGGVLQWFLSLGQVKALGQLRLMSPLRVSSLFVD